MILVLGVCAAAAQEPAPLAPLKGPHARGARERRLYADTLEKQLQQLSVDPQLNRFKQHHRNRSGEAYRPIYHYNSPQGRMNDPNGLCIWKGNYHLFYQAFPAGSGRSWGHAYSTDMVHWKELPVAIYPDKESDCYSGATLVEDNRVIAFYPGRGFGMRVAVSSDPLLLNWKKLSDEPLIPRNTKPTWVADSCIWKEGDGYYGVIAGRRNLNEFPNAPPRLAPHLFHSKDLLNWKYVNCLMDENEKFTAYGDDSSCPYFWPIGKDAHILVFFSHRTGGQYLLGDYDKKKHKFVPFAHDRFNRNGAGHTSFHAPSATPDGKGGVLVIHNVTGGLDSGHQTMSLPARLTVESISEIRKRLPPLEKKIIKITPVEALATLRKKEGHVRVENRKLPANKEVVFEKIKGNAMEIAAEINTGKSREIRILMLRSPDKREYTKFSYFADSGIRAGRAYGGYFEDALVLDVSNGSLRPDVRGKAPEQTRFDLKPKAGASWRGPLEPLKIRVFIDKSIVEVFVNDRKWMALRVYPSLAESLGFSITAVGRDAQLISLDAWQIKSIYETDYYKTK